MSSCTGSFLAWDIVPGKKILGTIFFKKPAPRFLSAFASAPRVPSRRSGGVHQSRGASFSMRPPDFLSTVLVPLPGLLRKTQSVVQGCCAYDLPCSPWIGSSTTIRSSRNAVAHPRQKAGPQKASSRPRMHCTLVAGATFEWWCNFMIAKRGPIA